MPFTEVSEESWFSRIKSAFIGILVGGVLLVASVPLLWWNEGRAVHTEQGLAELGKSVVSVSADRVDPQNEGKPVHVTAEARTDEVLRDDQFAVSSPAIKLRRQVEMYQWKENKKTRSRKKLGGGTRKETEYTYEKTWDEELIDSAEFREAGHENPEAMPFTSLEQVAQDVHLGAFALAPDLVAQMSDYRSLPVDASQLAEMAPELRDRLKANASGYYLGQDPASPQVGDVRITFQTVPPGTVSVIARQHGEGFEPWHSSADTEVSRLMQGALSAENMVHTMEAENTMLTWVLRLVGFAMMGIGVGLVLRPLAVLADVIPFLGSIAGFGIIVVGFFVGLAGSLVTISLAWLFYRPVLAIGLLIVAAMAIAGGVMLLRRRRPVPAAAPSGVIPAEKLPPLPTDVRRS